MKDKYKGITINKFIGLKSKMYCIVSDDDTEVSTANGVNISFEFNEYEDVLFNETIIRRKMKRIQSKKHKMILMMSTKCHYHVLMIKDTF